MCFKTGAEDACGCFLFASGFDLNFFFLKYLSGANQLGTLTPFGCSVAVYESWLLVLMGYDWAEKFVRCVNHAPLCACHDAVVFLMFDVFVQWSFFPFSLECGH